jgi:hypothetical protein
MKQTLVWLMMAALFLGPVLPVEAGSRIESVDAQVTGGS